MYDSMTKHNFDSIPDNFDRVSDAVDRDSDEVNTNNIKMTYGRQNDRYNDTVTKSKWSIDTNEIDS